MQVINSITTKEDKTNPHLNIESWENTLTTYTSSDFVISAFSCRLDPIIIKALQQKHTIVINLEYLSAEQWVEDCHGLQSFADNLNTYFFFPGFTKKTGGLNVDLKFKQQCKEHIEYLIAKQKQPTNSLKRKINLFSYENLAVKDYINSLDKDQVHTQITLFSQLSVDNINKLYKINLSQEHHSYDLNSKVSLKVSPMLSQEEFDLCLLDTDVNFVRGEDSIIRAMHTGNPFFWQIYIQDKNVHITKLQSFLDTMKRSLEYIYQQQSKNVNLGYIKLPDTYLQDFAYLTECMLSYNEGSNIKVPQSFNFSDYIQRTQVLFIAYAQYLNQQTTLSERLLEFLEKITQQTI